MFACLLAAAVVEMNCACTSYGRVSWSVSFRVHWVSCSCSFISFHMVHARSRLHDTWFFIRVAKEGKYNNLIFCVQFFFEWLRRSSSISNKQQQSNTFLILVTHLSLLYVLSLLFFRLAILQENVMISQKTNLSDYYYKSFRNNVINLIEQNHRAKV